MRKTYEYKVVVVGPYTGHLMDPVLVETLNREGSGGWRHREDQPIGSGRLAILLERETEHSTVMEIETR